MRRICRAFVPRPAARDMSRPLRTSGRDNVVVPRSYLSEVHKRVAPKRERIRPVIDLLAAEHQDAAIALRFRSPLELLVSVMLSAQTTDVNVNQLTPALLEKYRNPE